MPLSFTRTLLAASAIVTLFAPPLLAQPASELFIGYSYMHADPGEVTLEGGGTASLDNANLHGTELSGTYFLTRQIGLEVSFGYNQGQISFEGIQAPGLGVPIESADFKQYTFLGGPRVRLASTPRHNVEVRALVGGSNLDFRVPVGVTSFNGDEFGFAFAAGGSYTVVLNDVFSYRVVQPDVLIATAGPGTRANFRISTGLVFRFD